MVARGLGRPCVVGASDAHIDAQNSRLTTASGHVFGPGDLITLDGSEGTALAGAVPTRRPELTGAFAQLLRWADDARRMAVVRRLFWASIWASEAPTTQGRPRPRATTAA
ncbi:MAG: PEP-utilizing enzyme [Pseudomonadota bacterium]